MLRERIMGNISACGVVEKNSVKYSVRSEKTNESYEANRNT